jgi:hypothetical protein
MNRGKGELFVKAAGVTAGITILSGIALNELLPKRDSGPSFGVVKDGKCLISTDTERFTTDSNAIDLVSHTEGAYSDGRASKCFSDVLARIVIINHLPTSEDIDSDPNPIVQPDTEYLVPDFVTTSDTYEGTKLHVERVLKNHGYGN